MISNFAVQRCRILPRFVPESSTIPNPQEGAIGQRKINVVPAHYVFDGEVNFANNINLHKFDYIAIEQLTFCQNTYQIDRDCFIELFIKVATGINATNDELYYVLLQRGNYDTLETLVNVLNNNIYTIAIVNEGDEDEYVEINRAVLPEPLFKLLTTQDLEEKLRVSIAGSEVYFSNPVNPNRLRKIQCFLANYNISEFLNVYTPYPSDNVVPFDADAFFGKLKELSVTPDNNAFNRNVEVELQSSVDCQLLIYDEFIIKCSNFHNPEYHEFNEEIVSDIALHDELGEISYGSFYQWFETDIIEGRAHFNKLHTFEFSVHDDEMFLLEQQIGNACMVSFALFSIDFLEGQLWKVIQKIEQKKITQ